LFLSGLDRDRNGHVLIATLAHSNLVLAGQKQDLLRALELIEITKILAIHPDAGSPLDLRGANQFDLSQNFVTLSKDKVRDQEEPTQRQHESFLAETRIKSH